MGVVITNRPDFRDLYYPSTVRLLQSKSQFLWAILTPVVCTLILVLKGQIGTVPYLDVFYRVASVWPEPYFDFTDTQLGDSPLGYVLFQWLPFNDLYAYIIFNFSILFLAFVILTNEFSHNKSKYVFSSIFILSTPGVVLHKWIGNYDAPTFLLIVILFFALKKGQNKFAFAIAVLGGFQHFEIFILAFFLLMICDYFLSNRFQKFRLQRYLALFVFFTVGKCFLILIRTSAGEATVASRFQVNSLMKLQDGLVNIFDNLPVYLWSLMGANWIIFLYFFIRTSWKIRVGLSTTFFFAVFISAISEDHSRIFFFIFFPVLLRVVFETIDTASGRNLRVILISSFFVALMFPLSLLWASQVI